ncbi:hypothetical protein B0I35DRAFT_422401 [Stachybotrys elegans]|uniref:Uncharacterized protein n=1 Tax=Stachybotrys elegans TaxID=80388 RepID=A0A8K0T3A4_9HYPO|nr:hypothetical protein B0I35DRAFT_422401 [Stachybotrys elegans]
MISRNAPEIYGPETPQPWLSFVRRRLRIKPRQCRSYAHYRDAKSNRLYRYRCIVLHSRLRYGPWHTRHSEGLWNMRKPCKDEVLSTVGCSGSSAANLLAPTARCHTTLSRPAPRSPEATGTQNTSRQPPQTHLRYYLYHHHHQQTDARDNEEQGWCRVVSPGLMLHMYVYVHGDSGQTSGSVGDYVDMYYTVLGAARCCNGWASVSGEQIRD